MDEELVDVAEMLQHDVELSNDGVPIAGGEVLFPLADYIVKCIIVAFKQHLSTRKNTL